MAFNKNQNLIQKIPNLKMENNEIIYLSINEDEVDSRFGTQTQFKDTFDIFRGVSPNAQVKAGPIIRTQLSSLGKGYNIECIDFGSDIVIKITYTNIQTGRTSGQSFLLKLSSTKGEGIIKSSEIRYRTVSNLVNAVSYIKTKAGSLKQQTSSVI